MDISRRPFLKGLAASGLVVSAGGTSAMSARSLAGTPAPTRDHVLLITAIVTGNSYDSLFLSGVEAAASSQSSYAPAVLRFNGMDIDALKNLLAVLTPGQNCGVIGLTDDTSASIIVEAARSAGATMLWLGHHRANVDKTSSHRILTAASGTRLPAMFSNRLYECGEPFCVTEHRLNDAREKSWISAESHTAHSANCGAWLFALGALLVSAVTADQTLRQDLSPPKSPGKLDDAPASHSFGNFASFVFQV